MFVFQKIWRALFSWNTRFKIRPFALLNDDFYPYFIVSALWVTFWVGLLSEWVIYVCVEIAFGLTLIWKCFQRNLVYWYTKAYFHQNLRKYFWVVKKIPEKGVYILQPTLRKRLRTRILRYYKRLFAWDDSSCCCDESRSLVNKAM